MNKAVLFNFSFPRGDTVNFTLNVAGADSTPVDISNQTVWLTAKANLTDEDADAAIQKSVTFPSTLDAQNGHGHLSLTADETNIAPGVYYYDIQLVADGTPKLVTTLVTGKITVTYDVTRST